MPRRNAQGLSLRHSGADAPDVHMASDSENAGAEGAADVSY